MPELATLQQLFIPSEAEGYLPPPSFCAQVRRMNELANYQQVDVQRIVGVVATGIKPDAILDDYERQVLHGPWAFSVAANE